MNRKMKSASFPAGDKKAKIYFGKKMFSVVLMSLAIKSPTPSQFQLAPLRRNCFGSRSHSQEVKEKNFFIQVVSKLL